jgi:DNA-directed RNA polymerase specialized sigma24 family protein
MTSDPRNVAGGKTMHTLAGGSDFPTTRWTLVIAAADPKRTEARSALVSLCESYWYPLYAYVRRRGYPADQAQDLTQEFFIRVSGGCAGAEIVAAICAVRRRRHLGAWPRRHAVAEDNDDELYILTKNDVIAPLHKYLDDRSADAVVLTFAEIEDLAGFALPTWRA